MTVKRDSNGAIIYKVKKKPSLFRKDNSIKKKDYWTRWYEEYNRLDKLSVEELFKETDTFA